MSYLADADRDIAELIEKETERQRHGLELIASENYVSDQVMKAMGSTKVKKARIQAS